MIRALDDVQVEEPMRTELLGYFDRSSAHVMNHGGAVAIEAGPSNTPGNGTRVEISRRWDAQTGLDAAVTAIRSGDANRAIALAEGSALRTCGRSVLSGLLALMVRCGEGAMMEYVREKLIRDPALAQERYAGRTLLHEAAAVGSLPFVELLLSLGADPGTKDAGGHTPLYCVGNECVVEGAEKVVRALVHGGCDVDANDGV
jgi:hypothetical protein